MPAIMKKKVLNNKKENGVAESSPKKTIKKQIKKKRAVSASAEVSTTFSLFYYVNFYINTYAIFITGTSKSCEKIQIKSCFRSIKN